MKKPLTGIILLLAVALVWSNWHRFSPPAATSESEVIQTTRGSGEAVDYNSANLRRPLKDSDEVRQRIGTFEERLKDTFGMEFTQMLFQQTGKGKMPAEMRTLLEKGRLTQEEMVDSVYWACLAYFANDTLKESRTVPEKGPVVTTITQNGSPVNDLREASFSATQRFQAAAFAEAILKMPKDSILNRRLPLGM